MGPERDETGVVDEQRKLSGLGRAGTPTRCDDRSQTV